MTFRDYSYDNEYRMFEMLYPREAAQAKYWFPLGPSELKIVLEDGTQLVYNHLTELARVLYQNNDFVLDEDEWRYHFSIRIKEIMLEKGITQKILSERTGIAQSLLSQYMRRKVTPSAYTLYKIAEGLECSVYELTCFER